MIRNIQLAHWRAYETLDLSLTRPVTFLVAPNGVGKTSVVEAVRWGLLGTPVDRSIVRAIRTGHDSASVQLDLSMPGHADVRIIRTLRRNGAKTFEALIDGIDVDEVQFRQALRESWAASPELLDSIIFGAAPPAKGSGFPIRDHLADVFGIASLLGAATGLKAERDATGARIKSLRDDLSGTDEAIGAAAQEVVGLEAAIEALSADRLAAEQTARERDGMSALAAAWERYRAEVEAYSERTRSLVTEMAAVLHVTDPEPTLAIEAGELDARRALDERIAAQSAADVAAASAASGAELLSVATDRCPTCLRPLTSHERDVALRSHGAAIGDARSEADRRTREIGEARDRLASIAQFRRAFNELRAPAQPDGPDPGPEAAEQQGAARAQASRLAEQHGALTSTLEVAQNRLNELRRAADDQSALVVAARHDLVFDVTQKSLNAVADRYLAQRIEPLAQEIGRRWKLLFGSDGLQFGANGQLTLTDGDVELELTDLSGGERSTALLVTRLLLAGSATKASTIWFDEPLEHLDPRRRAAVAQTLVRAAQAGAVGQTLVTTYEEGLARRLASTAPDDVEVIHVETNPSEG